jgi:hypothetical protein
MMVMNTPINTLDSLKGRLLNGTCAHLFHIYHDLVETMAVLGIHGCETDQEVVNHLKACLGRMGQFLGLQN